MEFAKAVLQEVDSATPTPNTKGDPVVVQVNPSSLRMQLTNNVDVGKAQSRSATQAQGSSSSTLTFDLVFDTADEGTTSAPVDVRKRTAHLERFVLPDKTSPKSAPPRVRFTYGTLVVTGVMSALNVDFDLFAMSGEPLRAKCSVTIKEQKPEFDANQVGAGANKGDAATSPVPPVGGNVPAGAGPGGPAGQGRPGTAPPPPDRTGTALADESASDFAKRMGLDPRAWKDLAGGLDDPLRLPAGLKIDFSSSLSLDVGLGVEAGVTASLPAEPLAARPPSGPTPAAPPAEGTTLTAQGGLTRALDKATAARTEGAALQAKDAFTTGSSAGAGPAFLPTTSAAGAVTASTSAATVTADPRAASYGFGVPLRPRVAAPHRRAPGYVHDRPDRALAPIDGGVPETDDPTVPGWRALPYATAGAGAGAPAGGGCAGGCGCGGHCGGER